MVLYSDARHTYQREYQRRKRSDPIYRERCQALARARRLANPEKYRAYERGRIEYNRANKKRWRANNALWCALKNHRSNAKHRGLESQLTDAHVTDLITDVCFYCHVTPNPTNGVDRVDSSRGYTEDNVVTACLRCNQAKSNMALGDFVHWIENISRTLPMWQEVAQ